MYNSMGIKHLGGAMSFEGDPVDGAPRRARHLAQWIDPSWRSRSGADRNLAGDLAGILGPYLASERVQLTLAGNTLVIACRDRAGATEIRFLQREIRKTLHATGHSGVDKVHVLLAHRPDRPSTSAELPRVLPATAVQALRLAAASVDDPGLADALRRLARMGTTESP
jgi:hypothetical protein